MTLIKTRTTTNHTHDPRTKLRLRAPISLTIRFKDPLPYFQHFLKYQRKGILVDGRHPRRYDAYFQNDGARSQRYSPFRCQPSRMHACTSACPHTRRKSAPTRARMNPPTHAQTHTHACTRAYTYTHTRQCKYGFLLSSLEQEDEAVYV